MTAVLLAGGFGTRIKDIHPGVPKPMIPIEGKPFLEWALGYWRRQGITRVVISLGHLAEVAQQYFAQRPADGLDIAIVVEPRALGTAGAIQYVASQAGLSDPFVVANGDSLVAADCRPAFALARQQGVEGVLLGVRVPDAARYGTLDTDSGGKLLGFREKQPGAGVINAGVYVLRRHLIEQFPDREPLSIERDVFPELLARGAGLRVVAVTAPFLDIGTPESLAEASGFVRRVLCSDES